MIRAKLVVGWGEGTFRSRGTLQGNNCYNCKVFVFKFVRPRLQLFFCFFVLVTKTKNSGLYHISGPSDARYIRVETCMFMVKLPQYSTQEIMTEKLLYAINCREDPLTDIT